MHGPASDVIVRNTRLGDIAGILEMARRVYPTKLPWGPEQLAKHLAIFPEGQLVAVEGGLGRIIGMAASLIVKWDDYDMRATWDDFTAGGNFTNHDPAGRTLYGAEVMVHPEWQGRGVGKRLYAARRDLVRRLRLLRIRAGARLAGYHRYADRMSAEDYVIAVIRGELGDPTLSFQLKQRFRVIGVVPGYLRDDPQSLGHAAVIEWINHRVAKPRDYAHRDPRFAKPHGGRRGRRDESSGRG